jgi:hypothetical protein
MFLKGALIFHIKFSRYIHGVPFTNLLSSYGSSPLDWLFHVVDHSIIHKVPKVSHKVPKGPHPVQKLVAIGMAISW